MLILVIPLTLALITVPRRNDWPRGFPPGYQRGQPLPMRPVPPADGGAAARALASDRAAVVAPSPERLEGGRNVGTIAASIGAASVLALSITILWQSGSDSEALGVQDASEPSATYGPGSQSSLEGSQAETAPPLRSQATQNPSRPAATPSEVATIVGAPPPAEVPPPPPTIAATPIEAPLDRATLTLFAKEDCAIRISIDGVVLLTGMLRAGESRAWEGKSRVQVWTDNGTNLLVTANGHSLGALSSAVGHPDWNRVDWGWSVGWTP